MEPITWVAVDSSAISAIAYDPYTRRLWVRFKSGNKAYTFDGVPKAKWEGFLKAGSKGSYYHAHLQGRYPSSG